MSNIIVIESDKKISFQITKLFEEMSKDHKVFVFDTLESFESLVFDQEQKNKTPFPCETVDILYFNVGLIATNELNDWCKRIYSRLVQTKRYNQDKAPHDSIHFVAGTYESAEISKFDLMLAYIKDIIYYPIDRLLFMQKMEVLLALPKKTTPSYLFSEKVDLPIEISKRSEIIKINEVGFQIENPVQLIKGTTAHFYLHLDKNLVIEAYGRVSGYRASSTANDSFIVTFLFEGLSEPYMKALRLYLAKQKTESFLSNENDKDFLLTPLNMFAKPNEKEPKTIALITENEAVGGRLKEILEKSLSPIKVIYENSLHEFHKKYLPQHRPQPASPNEDLSLPKLSFVVDPNNENTFKDFIGQVSATDTICGESIEMLFKSEEGWQQLLQHDDAQEIFHKNLISLESEVPKVFNLVLTVNEKKRLFQITLFLNTKKQMLQIHIEPPNTKELLEKQNYLAKLDLMILDDSNAPEGFETWKTQINNYLNKKNMLKKANSYLKVLRLTEQPNEIIFQQLKDKHIQSIHSKAMNNNQLLMSIADLLKITYSKYNWKNVRWLEQKKPLHIGTPSHLESLSEFGAFIKHSRPIAPGTFLFLHKSIFDQAPNKSLCVRFYYTEEDSSDKEAHLSYFTYFGINDHFLKYVRSWIRENYAAKKNL